MGGVIYSDSADKAARFVADCNQRKIPLLFIQDVSGFMVGSKAEHGALIKTARRWSMQWPTLTVPRFTIITGNSYGAGNTTICIAKSLRSTVDLCVAHGADSGNEERLGC